MKLGKVAIKTATVAIATALSFGSLSSAAFADAHFDPGVKVFDNFSDFAYRPAPGSYWYTENRGYENGQEVNYRETPCNLQTCVHVVPENTGSNDVAMRLELHAHPYAGYFTLANLSE